jgi:type IV secretory pathway VirB2 component (pilin)
MPILLIGSGLVLILTGVNGDAKQLYSLIAQDFTGPGSFIYWLVAIVILGALGYVKGLEDLSKAFLILVLIVLFLDNGGFFAQFQAYVKQTQTPPPPH